MGIFDKLFGVRTPEPEQKLEQKPEPSKTRRSAPKKTAKELATERGEPYISIVQIELDPENIGSGSFELDWNDKFIVQLVKAGYQARPNEPENEIVDRWFQDICRNVVLETFEQYEANIPRSTNRRDIGNGRSEIS